MKKPTFPILFLAIQVLLVAVAGRSHAQELAEPEIQLAEQPPWLGIMMDMNGAIGGDAVDPEEREDPPKGVNITSTVEGGPAAKAGVKAGDRVLKIEGKEVKDSEELRTTVRKRKKGDKMALTILREGKEMEIKVELEALPADVNLNGGLQIIQVDNGIVQFDRATSQQRRAAVPLKMDRVQLRDGNVLRGKLSGMSADSLKMKFEEGNEVDLDLQQVVSVGLAGDKTADMGVTATLTLQGGTVLPAQSLTLKDGVFQLRFPGGTEASVPLNQATAVALNGAAKGIVLEGHRNVGIWRLEERPQGWSWQDGLLTTNGQSGQLLGTFPQLPDACVLTLEYALSKPDIGRIRLDLGRNFNSLSPGSITIDASFGRITVSQYDGRTYKNLEGKEPPKIGPELQAQPDVGQKRKLVVFLHRTKGKMIISMDGDLPVEFDIAKVKPEELDKLGREVAIYPIVQESENLVRLTQLSVLPWDGGVPDWQQITLKNNVVHLADGKVRSRAIVSIDDSQIAFEGGETIPRQSVSFAVLGPPVEAPAQGPTVARVELGNGSSLDASLLAFQDNKISVTLRTGQVLAFPSELVKSLQFERPAFKPDEAPAGDVLTFVSGRQWSGKLITPLEEGKVLWSIPAARHPIPVDAMHVAGVRLHHPAADIKAQGSDQIVRLRNGDWLSGQFLGIDDQSVKMKTAFSDSLTIPRDALASFYPNPATALQVSDGGQWDFDFSGLGYRDLSFCRSHNGKHTFVRPLNTGALGTLELPLAESGGSLAVGFTIMDAPCYSDLTFSDGAGQPLFRAHCYASQLMIMPRFTNKQQNRGMFGRQGVIQIPQAEQKAPMKLAFVLDESTRSLIAFVNGKRVGASKLGKGEEWAKVTKMELRPINVNANGQSFAGFWTAPWDHKDGDFIPKAPGQVAVALVNGDEIEGAFHRIEGTDMLVESDFGEIPLPLDRIAVVNFQQFEKEPAATSRIFLHPRGTLSVKSVKFAQDRLICTTENLGEITIPVALVRELVLQAALNLN